jgi:hypothetical protein
VILRRPATWRLPFHLTELCGRFSVAHAKNINAAQVPGLAVAHLAIDPLHHGTIPAYDEFFGLESRVGIRRELSAPELHHRRFSLDSPPVRRRRRILKDGVVGQKRCHASALCRLNPSLKSIVVRVACSCDFTFCSPLIRTSPVSPVDTRTPNRNPAHNTKTRRFRDRMLI